MEVLAGRACRAAPPWESLTAEGHLLWGSFRIQGEQRVGFAEKAALEREDKGAQRRRDASVQGEAPQHRVKGRGRAANVGGRDGKGEVKCAGPPWPEPGSRAPHVNGEDRSLDIKRMHTVSAFSGPQMNLGRQEFHGAQRKGNKTTTEMKRELGLLPVPVPPPGTRGRDRTQFPGNEKPITPGRLGNRPGQKPAPTFPQQHPSPGPAGCARNPPPSCSLCEKGTDACQ